MNTYLLLAKFSAPGATAIMSEGMVARRAVAEKVMGAAGGRLLGYYACGDGEWDLVNLMEWPDGTGAAETGRMLAMLAASGAYAAVRLMPLSTPEAYDAANVSAAQQAYRAPGQS